MIVFIVAAIVSCVYADVYMHNPRGSNDRLDEPGNRQNANRLFNSQNNNKGGYGTNVDEFEMKYYEGSWLTVEWTNQHACSNDNADCTLVLQYMCSERDGGAATRIRDGTELTTIDEDNYDEKEGGEYKYGMHEPLKYHQRCKKRERNKGLYLADQNVKGKDADYTRQNPNGQKFGFECQEERDYYPYWHPTPWKDIAVLTNDRERCQFLRENSQNTAAKGECTAGGDDDDDEAWVHNNEAACKEAGFEWRLVPAHGLASPDCLRAPWSRDNHLGNGITTAGLAGHMNHFNFTLPTRFHEPCVANNNCMCALRLRYNVSTADYQGHGALSGYGEFVDAKHNAKAGEETALLEQDPTIVVSGQPLAHALNTNQLGRTFQDRSHAFQIIKRDNSVSQSARILNVNVRGKRGNIVQVYPAVEYDFVPTFLVARQWDYVHFQWDGFDKNPNNGNNNAEGTQGTDRSNVCQVTDMGSNRCACDTRECLRAAGLEPLFEDDDQRELMAHLDQEDCKTYEELKEEHGNNKNAIEQDEQNCMKLNAANAYFDGGLVQLKTTGSFYYMSSRNNNFSNRSQKGSISVLPVLAKFTLVILLVGSALTLSALGVGYMVVKGRENPDSQLNTLFERLY